MSRALWILRFQKTPILQYLMKMYPFYMLPPGVVQMRMIQVGPQFRFVLRTRWNVHRSPSRDHMCYLCFCSTQASILLKFINYLLHHYLLCPSGYNYFYLFIFKTYIISVFPINNIISKSMIWILFLLNIKTSIWCSFIKAKFPHTYIKH